MILAFTDEGGTLDTFAKHPQIGKIPAFANGQRLRRGRHGRLRGDHQPDPAVDPRGDREGAAQAGRGRTGLVTTDLLDAQTPRDAPGTSRARRGVSAPVVVLVVVLVAASCASMLVGARIIPLEALFDSSHRLHGIAEVRVDRTLLGLAVGGRAGHGRSADAGPDPQPARRPRHPRHQRRRLARDGAGDLAVRLLRPAHLRLVRLRRRRRGDGAGAPRRRPRPRRRDPDEDRHRRRRAHRRCHVVDPGRAPHRRPDHRGLPALVGRHRSAAATPTCWPIGLPFLVVGAVLGLASIGSLNALALGDDLARGLGRRLVVDRFVIGLAIVLLAGAGDGAGRSDRLRRADRAARRTRRRRARLPPRAAAEHGVRRRAGPRRRRARPGRPPAERGAGRHHDRRRRGTLLPAADPAWPDGELCEP